MTDIVRRVPGTANVEFRHETTKRILDLVICLIAVIVCGPLVLLLCGLVRLTSPGPAVFKQERLGRDKRPFTMLKLRTMRTGNNDKIHRDYVTKLLTDDKPPTGGSSGLFKLDSDPRVTRLGSFLRRTSLDELPQIFNVLKGQMSLVGPRPVLPWEAEMFQDRYQSRFRVKPGLTGLWQIRGRGRLTMREGLELDIEYVQTRRLALDVSILLLTLPALLRGGTR